MGTQTRILYGDKFTYMMHYFDDIRNDLSREPVWDILTLLQVRLVKYLQCGVIGSENISHLEMTIQRGLWSAFWTIFRSRINSHQLGLST